MSETSYEGGYWNPILGGVQGFDLVNSQYGASTTRDLHRNRYSNQRLKSNVRLKSFAEKNPILFDLSQRST